MDQPLISIVLTTFNSEATIMDVLDAILKQNMPLSAIELIAVDDGSRDQTVEIVKNFIEKYGSLFHSVKLIVHDKNYGLSRARNDGIKASTGRYILVLDDDVIISESTLKNLLKFLESSPSSVAAVIPLHVEYPESTLGKWARIIRDGRITRASAITSCALIRREALKKIGLYDETLGLPFTMGEEIEYCARAKRKGYEALIDGFEKVIHVVDDKAWRGKSDELPIVSELRRKKISLYTLKKAFNAIRSIRSSSYRYAYKKYVTSLPFYDKLRWYAYLAVSLLMVFLIVGTIISNVFDWLISVTRLITIISLFAFLTLYIDILREYWNPKVLHISLAYSAVALIWRILRSTMLLTFMNIKKPDYSPNDR